MPHTKVAVCPANPTDHFGTSQGRLALTHATHSSPTTGAVVSGGQSSGHVRPV